MKSKINLFVFLTLLLNVQLYELHAQQVFSFIKTDTLSIMFYNVENLFDDVDDPILGDDEFSRNGLRAWNSFKYKSKIKKISQVILAANGWEYPALIGLSEIENRNVLNELISKSLLSNIGYKIIHKESSDHRGMDVGLLYDPNIISIIDSAFYTVELSENVCSRDILYAKLKFRNDILHIFVCHWPSRYSGALSSESSRMKASNILAEKCAKILHHHSDSKILIMGDFNDEPQNQSLLNLSEKLKIENKVSLHNLMDDKFEWGTIKYKNLWYLFDQFIISNSLLDTDFGFQLSEKPIICSLPFLLIKDEKYLGYKPFRTFLGYKYIGGYSDHFPILIKLNYNQDKNGSYE